MTKEHVMLLWILELHVFQVRPTSRNLGGRLVNQTVAWPVMDAVDPLEDAIRDAGWADARGRRREALR